MTATTIPTQAATALTSAPITPEQLAELRSNDPAVRILDVRTGGEYETAHIAGSYNVPLDTLAEHARDLAAVDHQVVLVCQTGGRATQAHGTLTSAGKDTLHVLVGGMVAWEASGGDVVRGTTERWAMDRQVRLTAGSLVLGAIGASLAIPKAKWIAGGVGAGLTYSALSNTCAMAAVLSKLPYNQTDACDIAGVLDSLHEETATEAR
ncbi:MAG: rhodanese-like domain-containing protein [Actinobacteria bacterium]|nr:rhodanese-like domain-containing protein [Actinomycetota bacterium]